MEISEFELQQSLQRFASRFTDRVLQAMEVLEHSQQQRIRDQAIRRALVYLSSALEIATGPAPAINLLDMFVFVRLCRAVLERHWMREFGEDGAEVGEAFARADVQITELVKRALGDESLAQLSHIVDTWLRENPHQTRVEEIRLADFAESAGAAMAARSRDARGLLSTVKSASRTATDALQLAERVMFLAHRLPFLWRVQARLGVRDVVSDTTQYVLGVVRTPWDRMTRLLRRGAAYATRMVERIEDTLRPPRLRA